MPQRNTPKTVEEFKERIEGVEYARKDGSTYHHVVADDVTSVRDDDKVHIICGNCGNQNWYPIVKNLLHGYKNHGYCGKCKPTRGLSDEEGKASINERRAALGLEPLEFLGAYVNDNTKIKVRRPSCGHTWEATPSNLKLGRGCPHRCDSKAKKSKEKEKDHGRS